MNTDIKETTEPHYRRSLDNILGFLEAYQPAAEERRPLVATLRDRARQTNDHKDVAALADAVDGVPFRLRGAVKPLPGLTAKLRACATRRVQQA